MVVSGLLMFILLSLGDTNSLQVKSQESSFM